MAQNIHRTIDIEKERVIIISVDEFNNVDYGVNNMDNVTYQEAMGILQIAILQMASRAIAVGAAAKQHAETSGIVKPQTDLILPR